MRHNKREISKGSFVIKTSKRTINIRNSGAKVSAEDIFQFIDPPKKNPS